MNAQPFVYDFSDQVVVVTGGARGLGLEIAHNFVRYGAIVFIGDADRVAGEDAVVKLKLTGGVAYFVELDVRDPLQAEAAAAAATTAHGRIDLWINNAGIARHGASETLSPDDWAVPIDIMLSGVFYGAQAAARRMLLQNGGTILNVASVNGLLAQAGRASYCSAKAGVVRLTEVLAAEWAKNGVRVNAIAPAVFLTDLARASVLSGAATMEAYVNRSPTRRLCEAEHVVATILFLASPYANYITGRTLTVDGGWTADHYI